MKVKVLVPFTFTDSFAEGTHMFDALPPQMREKVLDALEEKRAKLMEQVNFCEHTLQVLNERR